MNTTRDVKPITYLKNRTAELVAEVAAGRSVLITQNGEAKAVLIDVKTYDRWQNAMALLKLLAQSEADVKTGRTMSQGEAFTRAERTIRAAARDA